MEETVETTKAKEKKEAEKTEETEEVDEKTEEKEDKRQEREWRATKAKEKKRRGNKKEAESVILDAFDNLSRHLVDNAHNTRALEYILKTHGIKIGKAEYQIALTETMDK